MLFRHALPALCLLATAAASCGCGRSDKSASPGDLGEPSLVIALGAVYPITIQDSCGGRGKFSPCSDDAVTKIGPVVIADEKVVTAHDVHELPQAMVEPHYLSVLRANGVGNTSVKVHATFSDGTERTVEYDVSVERPTQARIFARCEVEGADPSPLLPGGEITHMGLSLRNRSTQLAGSVPNAFFGQGLRQTQGLRSTQYLWQAPEQPEKVTVTYPPIPNFELVLESFSPESVEIVAVHPIQGPLSPNITTQASVEVVVSGRKPCVSVRFSATTKTPDTCRGPDGAASWEGSVRGHVAFRPVSSGTCRLALAPQGVAVSKEVEFKLEVRP
jgi:hypothetical protein